ncbi:uncharacterized protein METZ01_LOCUS274011, partial [marine metagenome]
MNKFALKEESLVKHLRQLIILTFISSFIFAQTKPTAAVLD